MTKNNSRELTKHNAHLNKVVCESLQEALIILMNQKEFSEISISELCKKAGVSRMAFYNNYNSKEDLLRENIVQQSDKVLDFIGSPFREKTNIEWYQQMFTTAKEAAFELTTIFKAGFKYEYLSIINNIVLHNDSLSSDKRYMRLMWAGGIVNTIIYWIESGMKEPINEIATFCYNNLSVWTK